MMYFNGLDARTIRESVDMAQIWDAWTSTDDTRRHSFRGSIGWETRSGHEYLYSRKQGVVKSLGPRSVQTEKTYSAFVEGRAANKARLTSLAAEMDRQASILRSLRAGRLPLMAARALRAVRSHDKFATIRVVGTNALYGYESLAGVVFNSESTATGDVDILVDDRNILRLLTDDQERIGLTRLIQKSVDKSFQSRGPLDYSLTNERGYMIEFVRPAQRNLNVPTPGSLALEDGDVMPAPLERLQWLVNAPAIDTVVIDEKGYPAPMRCADPRYWALHKLWLAKRTDRNAAKKIRDLQQAEIVLKLIAEKLPHLELDDDFLAKVPSALRQQITK